MSDKTKTAKERPIIFSAPMVQAILAGEKSQTRRVIKPQPVFSDWPCAVSYLSEDRKTGIRSYAQAFGNDRSGSVFKGKYGNTGDRLWVRETWGITIGECIMPIIPKQLPAGGRVYYRVDEEPGAEYWGHWKSPIYMPRWASRILLEITRVGIARIQDITLQDAKAEGVDQYSAQFPIQFKALWNTIHAKDGFGWDANPWVWVIEFKRLMPEVQP